ncbi:hypothetical protein QFC20_006394 [Naganishia adeliensis]|uniref:Uncharacterized protein n=1 Tax=Naganishia adeliensis TaxID=92952 RepID=A0ACC2VCQ9_9TREE|nr:hypothetical protein QFC20_006394 [Naganishia adeliensis]
MVLINDKKYACATCIKGHRSSSCTHNERPLFEVKRKGRPVTQCQHCRQARRDKALHVKCECAAPAPTEPKPLLQATSEARPPATKAVFPNGFKDVHARNEAAEALHALTRNGEEAVEAKVRKVDALLNPCKCLSGGKCNCCRPRTKPSSGTSTPHEQNGQTSTDKLADMFSTVSTTSSSSAETSRVPPNYSAQQVPGFQASPFPLFTNQTLTSLDLDRQRQRDRAPREAVLSLPEAIWIPEQWEKEDDSPSPQQRHSSDQVATDSQQQSTSSATNEENSVAPTDRVSSPVQDASKPKPKPHTKRKYYSKDECSICLGSFERGDVIRILPCGHLFHKTEVDDWLVKWKKVGYHSGTDD